MNANDGTPSSLSEPSTLWPSCAISARVVAGSDLADVGEVGAGGEDELLAGDADRLDLPGAARAFSPARRLAELEQGGRAEGVRPGVVAAVVERDEREHLAARAGACRARRSG